MDFKQVMGLVYLFFFIGLMAYKLNHYFSNMEDGILMMGVVIAIIIMIVLFVRKIIYDY